MSYRPITDVMLLARPKVRYHGAFPNGFLARARQLLGVGRLDAVLHVCGGMIRQYPCKGFGPHDATLDLDPACAPDFLRDAREPFPLRRVSDEPGRWRDVRWHAVLIDRPYTEDDAERYTPGRDKLPPLNLLVKHAVAVVPVGGKVGVLDYMWAQPPKNATEIAVMAVGTGRNGRARWYIVFERTS